MSPSEAAIILGMAAAYDRRTVGKADAEAWAAALPDVKLEDAKTAVIAHYRESRDWMMPADVYSRVKRIRAERVSRHGGGVPELPRAAEVDGATYAAWRAAFTRAIGDGYDEAAADRIACESVGVEREPDEPYVPSAAVPAGRLLDPRIDQWLDA